MRIWRKKLRFGPRYPTESMAVAVTRANILAQPNRELSPRYQGMIFPCYGIFVEQGVSPLSRDVRTRCLPADRSRHPIRGRTVTRHRDFKRFHYKQATAFKRHLAEQTGQRSGEKLSKATLHATLTQLKTFFRWLSREPGYKSHIQYPDAEYFNLSDKDTRIATAHREQKAPTLEQIKHVIQTMPARPRSSAAIAHWWPSLY